MSSDPRCHPLVELSRAQVREMLRPLLGGAGLREVVRVDGGLVNTVYRVKADGETYALRVCAADGPAFEKECRLLNHLAKSLPVPRVLFADASGRRCALPYLVYRWVEGVSLNECRRQSSPDALLKLAGPLGRLLAQIADANFPADHVSKTMRVATLLRRAEEQLRAGLARQRLGGALADQLCDLLNRRAAVLHALDDTSALVHGDFGGRNVLVRAGGSGEWEISDVIDWDEAAAGSALWDVGSLFRYPRRYSDEFRTLFERGHRAAGGRLPLDWWHTARTIDATRLVAILGQERELPGVFAECAELIRLVITEGPALEVPTGHGGPQFF